MALFYISFLFYVILLRTLNFVESARTFKLEKAVIGTRLTNARITSQNGLTFLSCTEQCTIRTRCVSVNYIVSFRICELNYKSLTDNGTCYVKNAYSIYIEKDVYRNVSISEVSFLHVRHRIE